MILLFIGILIENVSAVGNLLSHLLITQNTILLKAQIEMRLDR